MTEEPSEPSVVPLKVLTGHNRLDAVLQGGLLAGSEVVLTATASDEVPNLLKGFLRSDQSSSLLICKNLSSSQAVAQDTETTTSLICSNKPVSVAGNIRPGRGIDNLTELNLTISETLDSVRPKRVVLDILSDVLLRHKALQTRRWLNELLERLRSRGITTIAVLNPYMHQKEDVQAIMDLFDGNLEIVEKEIDLRSTKFMRINWMHGIQFSEPEFQLTNAIVRAAAIPIVPFRGTPWYIPLVGRTEELSQLKAAFKNSLTSGPSIIALQGETGTGKTRLMHELATHAQSNGAVVIFGNASEEMLPYAPWIDACRQSITRVPSELLIKTLGPYASEIVKLVPDIATKLGTFLPSEPLVEQHKYRFYEGLIHFFQAICNNAPLILIFDDMQYADQPTLDLMEYFVRNVNLHALIVCGIASELEANTPIDQTLMRLNQRRLLETVSLKGLSKDETARMITDIFDEKIAASEFIDLLYQRTAGNPFFIEEVTRSLAQDGTIIRTESGWARKEIQEITLPRSVKNVLKARLAKLDSASLTALTIAAVIGLEFDFNILLETSQLDEEQLLARIEQAIALGLVLEIPRELNQFKFTDYRVRELLLEDISHARRAKHHLKIAETMEQSYAKETIERRAEILAGHFLGAGDIPRTVKYSMMGGDRNRSIHAYEQAVANYKRAAEVIDEEDYEKRAIILEQLGHCFRLAGYKENSAKNLRLALGNFEKLRDNKSCSRISVELSMVVDGQEGINILKRALKFVRGNAESYEAASIYSELASDLATIDEYDQANFWNRRALNAGAKSGNFAAIADALGSQAAYLLDTGRIAKGLQLSEKALKVAKRHYLHRQTRIQLLNLAYYTLPLSLPKARIYAAQWYEFAKQENTLPSQARSLAALSFFDWLAGRWTLAQDEMNKAFQMQAQHDFKFTAYMAEVPKGLLHLGQGDLEEADKCLQESLAAKDPKITTIVGVYLGLGKLRMEQGREREAKLHFMKCVEAFKVAEYSTAPLFNIEVLLHLTSIYSKQGQREKAWKTVRWAKRLAQKLKSDAGLAMAYQAEANVRLASGDQKRAEVAYVKSLKSWKKAGWVYYYAKALAEYSKVVARTNTTESKRSLGQAIEIFKKLQARLDLERLEINRMKQPSQNLEQAK